MRIRVGFVSNSSTSSYVCEICLRCESITTDDSFGTLLNYGFKECSEGHVFCDKHTTWHESPYRWVADVVHEASGLPMGVAMNVMMYLVKPGRSDGFTEDIYGSDTDAPPEEDEYEDEEEDKKEEKKEEKKGGGKKSPAKKKAEEKKHGKEKKEEKKEEKKKYRKKKIPKRDMNEPEGYWEWRAYKEWGKLDDYEFGDGYETDRCPVCNCSARHDRNMLDFLLKSRGIDEREVLDEMQKERFKFVTFSEFQEKYLKTEPRMLGTRC